MHQIDGRIFIGGIDTDTDPTLVEQGDYIDAMNIVNGFGATVGTVEFVKGTTAIAYTMPSGTNTCIGWCEDKFNNRAIFFYHNTNDNHLILAWDPLSATVKRLAGGSALDFSNERRITHAHVVNGKILYWVDAVTYTGDIEGSHQKCLDLERADRVKLHTFEIYAGLPNEGQFANTNTYAFQFQNIVSIGTYPVLTLTADGSNLDDPAAGLQWLKTELIAFYGVDITIDDCDGCKLKITVNNSDLFINMSTSDGDAILVNIDDYPLVLQDYHVDLLKEPAHCAPSAQFVGDASFAGNLVKDGCFQFIVRYIYYNGERSAWSPVSNVAMNIGTDGETIEGLNAIEIDFTDPRLSDAGWLGMIRHVEVAFRDGNVNNFYLIKRVPACELGIQRQFIKFLNNQTYSAVASDESGSADLQVIKPFDFLPIKAATLAPSADAEGNTILFQGATLEGYDCPSCVDVDFQVQENDPGTIDIVGVVEVVNNVNFPSADPDFDQYPMGGFVVYLAGTRYFAVSNNPADGTGDGSFRIKNVPKGKYIIRVASHRCSFGSPIAPRYDLNNGLEWQRTSAPVTGEFVKTGGAGRADGITEYLIDTSAFTGTEYDLETEHAPGKIKIQNMHFSDLDNDPGDWSFQMREIYVLDNEAQNTDMATRIGALNAEEQRVQITLGMTIELDTYTDHNGYFYWTRAYMGVAPATTFITLFNCGALEIYKGDYDAMYSDTLTSTFSGYPDSAGVWFLFNEDEAFSARKKTVFVAAQDANGDPVQGAVISLQGTTRTVTTPTTGDGRIIAWIPTNLDPGGTDWRTEDKVIVLYPNDPQHDQYGTDNYLVSLDLSDPAVISYVFTFQFIGGLSISNRYLKAGGSYKVGILYEDRGNRTCGVAPAGTIEIPWHVGGLKKYSVNWQINSLPPDWATHYRFVFTKNRTHKYYVQWGVKSVIYARVPSQVESPIVSSFANGDATHLYLELYVPPAPPSSGAYYLPFYQADGQFVYSPEPGDRVRILLDPSGTSLVSGGDYLEAPVIGTYVDGDKIYAAVENRFGNTEIKAGSLAEYFAPGNQDGEVYYEGGEECYDVVTGVGGIKYHAGPDQTQTASLPALGTVSHGDTYWRNDSYTGFSSLATEHQSLHRGQYAECRDIGRAFLYDPDQKELFFLNRVRFSGRYIVSSDVNGLSSYRALDFKDINRDWGIINWLGFANNVLLAICRYKVQPIYVNKNNLMTLDGAQSVGRSDRLLQIADESVTNYGTHNPESVVVIGGYVYAWDKFNGTPWRYAVNGVEAIDVKMVKYFREKGKQRLPLQGDVVVGGHDRQFNRVFFSFNGSEVLVGDTVSFDTVKGRWDSRHNYQVEAFAAVGLEFLSAKRNGATYLWRHNHGTYSNFHGNQFKPFIKVPFNMGPAMTKIWHKIRVVSNKLWTATTITVPSNVDYAAGMSSRLKAGRWNSYEGAFWAEFLRDMNDTSAEFLAISDIPTRQLNAITRGRKLRGEVIIITLTANDGAVATNMRRVDVYFSESNVTNG